MGGIVAEKMDCLRSRAGRLRFLCKGRAEDPAEGPYRRSTVRGIVLPGCQRVDGLSSVMLASVIRERAVSIRAGSVSPSLADETAVTETST